MSVRELPIPKDPPRPPWRARFRRAFLTWWRTTTVDIGITAVVTVALSVPTFWLAIMVSPFTPALKFLWSAVLLAVTGLLTFVYGYWREQQAAMEAHLESLMRQYNQLSEEEE